MTADNRALPKPYAHEVLDPIACRPAPRLSLLKRYEWVLLIVVLTLSAIVRLPGMVDRPIWYDEVITLYKTTSHFPPVWPISPTPVREAMAALEATSPTHVMAYHTANPYFWLLFQWRQIVGKSIGSARALSLVFSLGTIGLLYLLLRAAAVLYPLIPTLVYALSSGAVDYGHEARAYALACFLLTGSTLCAYKVATLAGHQPLRTAAYGLGMLVGSLIAFPTHYLTLLPICVIWLWVFVCLWPVYRSTCVVVVVVSLATAGIGLLGIYLSELQIPSNFEGGVDFRNEIKALLNSNLGILWVPKWIQGSQKELSQWVTGSLVVAYSGWIILIGATLFQLYRQWSSVDRKFWLLIFGLACAPTLGVFVADGVLDIHLHRRRYVLFAGPALAIIVSYSLIRLMVTRYRWGMAGLACVLTLQMSGIYWGPSSRADDRWARWAQSIRRAVSSSHIVAIVGHWPHQGALIHELNALAPDTEVVSVQDGNDIVSVYPRLQPYQDVWIAAYPKSSKSLDMAHCLGQKLLQSGQYTEGWRSTEALHLRRMLSSAPVVHKPPPHTIGFSGKTVTH